MRPCKDLIGKSVVSISDGRIIGEVKDLYLNAAVTDLTGIHLGKEGLLRRKSLLIPAEEVVVFGIDVILVRDSNVVTDDRTMKESLEWVRLEKIIGREIDTPGGTKIGMIGDAVLNEQGRISGYALSRVYVEGPLSEKRMVPRDAILDNGNLDGIMTIDLPKAEGTTPDPVKETAAPLAPAPVSSTPPPPPPSNIISDLLPGEESSTPS